MLSVPKEINYPESNEDFFNNNFADGSFQLAINNSVPLVNGDDAVELFFGDQVVDVFGSLALSHMFSYEKNRLRARRAFVGMET